MTQFRSKQDGTHYPLKGGKKAYPSNKEPTGMRRFILIRDGRILIPHRSIGAIEKEYKLEYLAYTETGNPLFHRDEYFVTQDYRNDAPQIEIRRGNNEGYVVTITVYDEKTYDEIGHLNAKGFDKEDAMRFAKDVWNITGSGD